MASSQRGTFQEVTTRRNIVPIVYTRGTHYDIGYNIGSTFASMIQDFVRGYSPLNDTYLTLYETEEGRKIYEDTLACVRQQFPQYVQEIEGTASGSGVPFYKLFLMHLDDIIIPNTESNEILRNKKAIGCTSIVCNYPGQEIIGHNEDAYPETLNHWYLVDAHVIEPGLPEEKFTSLCYAGFLPGYTMGYNRHGLVFSVDTIFAKYLRPAKTPRYFLTRALLNAKNFEHAKKILLNDGHGAAEGFVINMTFLSQESVDRTFYNVEVGPVEPGSTSSLLNVKAAGPNECFAHCNIYLRLKVPEITGEFIESSVRRHKVINKYPVPKTVQAVKEILSDQTDEKYRIYRDVETGDFCSTITTGVFDCVTRTWSLYNDRPSSSEPVVILPMNIKSYKK